ATVLVRDKWVGAAAEAEAAANPEELGAAVSNSKEGKGQKTRLYRRHGSKRFLMAVAVQQRALGHGLKRELERALLRLARQELLEQKRMGGQAAPVLALHERRDLVAETQHAARLETDAGNTALAT